jgi:hypothetical protein
MAEKVRKLPKPAPEILTLEEAAAFLRVSAGYTTEASS